MIQPFEYENLFRVFLNWNVSADFTIPYFVVKKKENIQIFQKLRIEYFGYLIEIKYASLEFFSQFVTVVTDLQYTDITLCF